MESRSGHDLHKTYDPQLLPSELRQRILDFAYNDWRGTTWGDRTRSWKYRLKVTRILFVSRTWRVEGERFLYKHVAIPYRRILHFCRTLDSRPDLARFVKSLVAHADCGRVPHDGELNFFVRILRSLKNLSSLIIYPSVVGYAPDAVRDHCDGVHLPSKPCYCLWREEDTWMLKDLGCSLKYLAVNDLCWNQDLIDVLAQHPKIAVLDLHVKCTGGHEKPHSIPHTLLQECKHLIYTSDFISDLPVLPPVKELCCMLEHEPELVTRQVAPMTLLGESLTVLYIERQFALDPPEYLASYKVLEGVASATPNLRVLSLFDPFLELSPRENQLVFDIICDNWPNLQVFMFGFLYSSGSYIDWDADDDDGISIDSDGDLSSTEKLCRFATDLMVAKPTLKFFITEEPVHDMYIWERLELANGMTTVCMVESTLKYPWKYCPGVGWWHTNDGFTPLEHLEYLGYPMNRLIVFTPGHPFLDTIGPESLPDEVADFVDTMSNVILDDGEDHRAKGFE